MKGAKLRHAVILILFFLSGAVGLAYEVVWARQLSLFLGVSIYAVSAVLVAFMGGLGIGAEFFGRKLDQGVSPIRLYSILEIGLGIYVLFFPIILQILENMYVFGHGAVEGNSIGVISLRFVLAVAALLPPTILMGGTLPALVRYFSKEGEQKTGRLAGSLYSINTLGAMTGCLIAGFLMIEYFGFSNTLRVGACLNIAIGVMAWLIAGEPAWRLETVVAQNHDKRKKDATQKQSWDITLLVVYGISGFIAMALQLLWTRTLILLLNNTTYAFSIILAVFLFGIGTGSVIASRITRSSPQNNLALFAFFQIGVGIMALGSLVGFAINQSVIKAFSTLVADGGLLASSIPGGEPLASAVLFCLFVVTPCALLMGGCFPLIVEAISTSHEKAGGEVGRVYGVNIIGCVLGSIAAGYVLIPLMGIQNSLIAVSWLAVITGAYVLLTRAERRQGQFLIPAFIIMAPLTGFLSYNSDIAFYLSAQKLDSGSEVIFYEEGPSATVLVSSQESDLSPGRKPVKRLWIDGDPIAGAFREALQLERLQAHIPLLLHPDPKNALVICFGTGSTAGAALSHGLENVKAVDISRETFNAASAFKAANLDVINSPGIDLVEEDGRNYLLTTSRRFDFITSEPPPPSNAGIVSLYTKEFYETLKPRLKKNGIVSQWIPLHHLSEHDFKSLVSSFVDVFPEATMWYTKWDAIMIGSEKEIAIDLDLIQQKMERPAVAQSLAGIGITNSFQLVANYMMGPEQLRKYVAGIPPLTDDRPTVEFTAPRIHVAKGVVIKGKNLTGILKQRTPPKTKLASDKNKTFEKYFGSQTIYFEGQVELNNNKRASAASHFSRALQMNNDNPDARYAYLSLNLETLYAALVKGKMALALEMLKDTEEMDKEKLFTPQLRFLNGMFFVRLNMIEEAEKELKEAIRLDEEYILAIVNLAGLYDKKLNQPFEAKRLYSKALELKTSDTERLLIINAMKMLKL